ncbi:MAG: 3-dehydroquinate synthase [Sphingomonadales bacterium]
MTQPHDRPERERVRVELGDRGYDIVIGADVIDTAGDHLAPLLKRSFTIIVTDQNVAPLYNKRLCASLDARGISHDLIVIPAGEQSKSFAGLEDVLERLIGAAVERTDIIVALGGGVVGDLAGFAASILRRGVDFVQIPTTLLAQVDSAVGGKTAINSRSGKNLIGSFHQPRLVLADISALDTLPARQMRAGYAEVVKYGLIGDRSFFDWLERHGTEVLNGVRPAQRRAVAACCTAKARIVADDERETGRRALLNLGHTFGHALEAETGYGEALLHGEAVAIGTVLAFDLSVGLGLCPADDARRVRDHFASVGLPVSPRRPGNSMTSDALLAHMRQDKKVSHGKIPFILCRGIGKAFVADNVEPQAVRDLLDAALSDRTGISRG